jgi:hypothetical protein
MPDDQLPTTREILLSQLQQDPYDQAGWDEFVARYGGHIYSWCRQRKLQHADADGRATGQPRLGLGEAAVIGQGKVTAYRRSSPRVGYTNTVANAGPLRARHRR